MRRVLVAGLLLVAAGCGSQSADEVSAPAPAPAACEAFDLDEAALLVTTDKGVRRLDGDILSAVVVLSDEKVPSDQPINGGRQLSYVAINVGGTVIAMAHPVDGVWASLDDTTEQATLFPQNASAFGASGDSVEALAAIECAKNESVPSTTALAAGFDTEAWRAEAIERFGPEKTHTDGSKSDYVDLAVTLCEQTPSERKTMLDNLGAKYPGSFQEFVHTDFCPNL